MSTSQIRCANKQPKFVPYSILVYWYLMFGVGVSLLVCLDNNSSPCLEAYWLRLVACNFLL